MLHHNLILILLAYTATGCASFRGFVRDLNNTDMSDREAPELVLGEWVSAGAPVAPTASWQLLVFFMPT